MRNQIVFLALGACFCIAGLEGIVQVKLDDEQRALATADYFLSGKEYQKYRELRQEWLSKEQHPHQWLFYDAEALFLTGDSKGAVALLNEHSLFGKEETDRLVRLASLQLVENPAEAWHCLNEACLKDSHNPDLHLFKATLLESHDKNQEAEKEYLLAVQKDENNLLFKEELVDFYLRQTEYDKALKWLDTDMRNHSASGNTWLKAFFLTRVVKNANPLNNLMMVPSDSFQELILTLHALPQDHVWDEKRFTPLLDRDVSLQESQEVFWLRLVEALKNQRERKAERIVSAHAFGPDSLAPDLEASLKNVLSYRHQVLTHQHNMVGAAIFNPNMLTRKEDFLKVLAGGIPSELHDMMLRKDILAMLFLAQGWNKAALQLQNPDHLPVDPPEWALCCWAEALIDQHGHEKALQFLSKYPSTSATRLMMARLLIDDHNPQAAYPILSSMYRENDEAGAEAALLMASLFLADNNIQAAKEAILQQPILANHIIAREILARAFLQEGEKETASRLYLSLEAHSYEAKSFLAQKAFIDHDWNRARQLTVELLEVYPNSHTLQDNLKALSISY